MGEPNAGRPAGLPEFLRSQGASMPQRAPRGLLREKEPPRLEVAVQLRSEGGEDGRLVDRDDAFRDVGDLGAELGRGGNSAGQLNVSAPNGSKYGAHRVDPAGREACPVGIANSTADPIVANQLGGPRHEALEGAPSAAQRDAFEGGGARGLLEVDGAIRIAKDRG
eukprot:9503615-Pyramimonas_sp.AAC.1